MIEIHAKSLLEAVDFLFITERSRQDANAYLDKVFITVRDEVCQLFRYGISVVKHSALIECEAPEDMHCQVDYNAFKAILTRIAQRFETVTISYEKAEGGASDTLKIHAGNLKTSLKVTKFEIPEDKEFVQDREICVNVVDLQRIIKNAKVASAKNDVRYYLNGLLLETDAKGVLRAIATDGHRMATSKCQYLAHAYNEHQIILSNDGVRYIEGLLKVCTSTNLKLHFNDSHLCADLPNGTMLKMQVIDGRFPDWRRVIPLNTQTDITVDRKGLLESAQAALPLTNSNFRAGRFCINKDCQLEISTTSDIGDYYDAIDIDSFDGEGVEIGINMDYLISALGSIEDDVVLLGFNGSNSAMTIQEAENPTGIQLLMPLRL